MKKTLTINISGIIFHIDEDAYDKLNVYLNTLKRHFSNTHGKDEIIADIEGRIAELLQERISDAKQVINIEDVTEVISLMGDPGQFESDEDEAEAGSKESATYDDIRGPKRLYRDPDGKMVGGVASGLAAYLNIDVLWVRLAFVLLTIFWLSGTLVYLVLWIAMPEARTTAEKLQMKGEKVNITNIEKSIKEEVNHLKDKLNDLTNQAKKTVEKKNSRDENVFEQILGVFLTILKVFFKIIVVITGIALLLAGIGLVIAFLFAVFGWGGPIFIDDHEAMILPLADLFTLLPISTGGESILKLGLLLFIGIPLVMLIYNAFRMIFGIERMRYVGITALNIWIVGLIITLFFFFRVAREYRMPANVTQPIEMAQPAGDTLYLSVNKSFVDQLLYDSYDVIHAEDIKLVINEEGQIFEQIEINISKSPDAEFLISKQTYARGRTKGQAKEKAYDTKWHYEQDGNTIIFDPYFSPGEEDYWSAQHIDLNVKVPVGKYLHIDKNMRDLLDWSYYSPYKLAGKTWIMTEDGLRDPDEAGIVSPIFYREEPHTAIHPVKPIIMHIVGLVW